MKNRTNLLVSGFISLLSLLFFFLITARAFAKEVLVDRLDIRNELVSMLADYYWVDQLSRHPLDNTTPGQSEEYSIYRSLYDRDDDQISDADMWLFASVADVEIDIPADTESKQIDTDRVKEVLNSYNDAVGELEKDINHYCNYHFVIRPYITEMKLFYYDLIGWNMAYARNLNDFYLLKSGYTNYAQPFYSSGAYDTAVIDLAEKYGASYLYVQYPFRVEPDDELVPYGAESNQNENADMRIEAMRRDGISVLDLRSGLKEQGWDPHEGFYLTDGHWKTESAFLSAGIIAAYLSENYSGFTYHTEYHDESSYNVERIRLNNPMIWETVDLYMPRFDTDFRLIKINSDIGKDKEITGPFSESLYDLNKADSDRFANVLSVYSSSNIGSSSFVEITNRMDDTHYGTVLIISNSYSWHLIPYLAMECDKIYFLSNGEKEITERFLSYVKPDIVIETGL